METDLAKLAELPGVLHSSDADYLDRYYYIDEDGQDVTLANRTNTGWEIRRASIHWFIIHALLPWEPVRCGDEWVLVRMYLSGPYYRKGRTQTTHFNRATRFPSLIDALEALRK